MRLRLHAEFAPAGVLGVSALSFVSTDKTKRTDRRKLWQVQHKLRARGLLCPASLWAHIRAVLCMPRPAADARARAK